MPHPFYDKYWQHRNGCPVGNFDLKWPYLARFIPREKNIAILDYGCGRGEAIYEMQKVSPYARYMGIDVSNYAIEAAQQRIPSGTFLSVSDGERFLLDDNSIDFVFSSEVIEHVYDTEHAASELARVLKKGGKMLITTPFHGFIKNLFITTFAFDRHFDPTGGHVRFFTKRSLESLLERHGFRVLECDYFGRFYPLSHSIVMVAEKVS